jgi:hypothetical protein
MNSFKHILFKILTPFFILFSFQVAFTEFHMEDEISESILIVAKDLYKGKNRGDILNDLNKQIVYHPKSPYIEKAIRLKNDIQFSIEKEKALSKNTLNIQESKFFYKYLVNKNKKHSLNLPERKIDNLSKKLMKLEKEEMIDLMLPLLEDRSPVRALQDFEMDVVFGAFPNVIRVCDVAIKAIEIETGCSFFYNFYSNKLFSSVSSEHQQKVKKQIVGWWKRNRDRSYTDGLVDQIKHTELHWWNNSQHNREHSINQIVENRRADKYNGHYSLLKMYYDMVLKGDNKKEQLYASNQLKSFLNHSEKDFADVATYYLRKIKKNK